MFKNQLFIAVSIRCSIVTTIASIFYFFLFFKKITVEQSSGSINPPRLALFKQHIFLVGGKMKTKRSQGSVSTLHGFYGKRGERNGGGTRSKVIYSNLRQPARVSPTPFHTPPSGESWEKKINPPQRILPVRKEGQTKQKAETFPKERKLLLSGCDLSAPC